MFGGLKSAFSSNGLESRASRTLLPLDTQHVVLAASFSSWKLPPFLDLGLNGSSLQVQHLQLFLSSAVILDSLWGSVLRVPLPLRYKQNCALQDNFKRDRKRLLCGYPVCPWTSEFSGSIARKHRWVILKFALCVNFGFRASKSLENSQWIKSNSQRVHQGL